MTKQANQTGSQETFNQETCRQLDYYVYRLIDPRNGETFYVGKGQGNRIFQHVQKDNRLLKSKSEDKKSLKYERIDDIKRSGMEVQHIIHRHGIRYKEIAYEVEAALIDAYSGLTNDQNGHHSNDRGVMHVDQILYKYQLPKISEPPEHKLLLININRFDSDGVDAIYHQVRFSWRLDQKRANKADFVLAVQRGVVIGVFKVDSDGWRLAIKENFSELPGEESQRYGFSGQSAPDEIWEMYAGSKGKRIELDEMRHIQNPIRYYNV